MTTDDSKLLQKAIVAFVHRLYHKSPILVVGILSGCNTFDTDEEGWVISCAKKLREAGACIRF